MADDFESKWGVVSDAPPQVSVSDDDFDAKWGMVAPQATAVHAAATPAAPPILDRLENFSWAKLKKNITDPEKLKETIIGGAVNQAGQALTTPGDVYQGNTSVDDATGRIVNLAGLIGTGGIPSVIGKSAPLIDPATASLASIARDKFGIPLRGGQISESRGVNYLDSVLKDKPFSGYSANVGEQHAAFNRAVAKTIGEDADKVTPEVMANAKERLGQNYDTIAANTTIKADEVLGQDLSKIALDANSALAPGERSIIHGQINNILDKIKNGNPDRSNPSLFEIDGDAYKALVGTGSPLDRATKSADSNVKYYAGQVKQALIDALGRHAPEDMQALLKKTNSQYKAMKTIEDLVEKSPTGDISPALLMTPVRQSYSNMAYGGGGDLADLARIGQRFLKEPPNSGTANRLSAMMKLGSAGLVGGGEALAYHLQDPVLAAKIAALGLTTAVAKGITNKAAGSVLRSKWYANHLIGSDRSPQSNMLQRLMQSDTPYLPNPATIPQITVHPLPQITYSPNSL